MSELPERIEREMFEIRSRMAPDVRDLKKHAEPQVIVKRTSTKEERSEAPDPACHQPGRHPYGHAQDLQRARGIEGQFPKPRILLPT